MQQQYGDLVRDLFSWRERRSGTIMPEERLPWGNTIAMGMQHVLAMFGSTVVAPLLMGFDPNLAILFSGIGTLLFFLITWGRIPSYLGSSFAFIAPVGAVAASGGGMKEALGGIVVCGLVYLIIGVIVVFTGAGWIDALMPPLVTGAVVTIIGLNLAGAARNLAVDSMPLAIITILAVMGIAIAGGGMIGRLPILIGTVFGYLVALILGGTSADGRNIGPMHISGIDFQGVKDAAWIGWPDFTTPSFSWHAISLIAPVALVLVAENTGHIKAVSEMTGRNLMPHLGRGFIGDGVATMVAGAGGGTGVTTYAENIGVMAVTRVFSTAIFIVAAITAVLLGFIPKFGALIGSIPNAVLGGVSTVLFGLIAITGVRIWVENRVDFSKSTNLFIAAVTVIVGAADYTLHFGDFELGGIAIGTFGSIILYQVFKATGLDQAELVGGPADAAIDNRPPRGGGRRPAPRDDRRGGRATMAIDPRALREAFGDEDDDVQILPNEPRRRPATQPRTADPRQQRPAQQRATAREELDLYEDWGTPQQPTQTPRRPATGQRPTSGSTQPTRRPASSQQDPRRAPQNSPRSGSAQQPQRDPRAQQRPTTRQRPVDPIDDDEY